MKLQKLKNLLFFTIFSIFALQLVGLVFLMVAPPGVRAADNAAIEYAPQVEIPGSDFAGCMKNCFVGGGGKISEDKCREQCAQPISGKSIAEYIKAWYKFAVAAVGILATVMIMGGGLIWLTAGGNTNRIGTAKEWIGGAVAGLVLALMSYTLLEILNPSLVNFESLKITDVGEVGLAGSICCDPKNGKKTLDKNNGCTEYGDTVGLCNAGQICKKQTDGSFACATGGVEGAACSSNDECSGGAPHCSVGFCSKNDCKSYTRKETLEECGNGWQKVDFSECEKRKSGGLGGQCCCELDK
jgi:hypothetical protein